MKLIAGVGTVCTTKNIGYEPSKNHINVTVFLHEELAGTENRLK